MCKNDKGEEVGIFFIMGVTLMSILRGKRGKVQVRMILSLFCRVCLNKAQSSEESQSEKCIAFFRKSEACSTVRDIAPSFLPS